MERMGVIGVPANSRKEADARKDQRGFNIIEFLILAAFLAVLALIVVPNMNLFLGVERKLAAANVEASNVRDAASAYEANNNRYPADSDVLLSAGNYIGQPRAYYTFDIGTGRIINATTDTVGHIPADAWTGIKWDYTSGSWVKR
jgi:type II secretory pathway pseudopilin PulG